MPLDMPLEPAPGLAFEPETAGAARRSGSTIRSEAGSPARAGRRSRTIGPSAVARRRAAAGHDRGRGLRLRKLRARGFRLAGSRSTQAGRDGEQIFEPDRRPAEPGKPGVAGAAAQNPRIGESRKSRRATIGCAGTGAGIEHRRRRPGTGTAAWADATARESGRRRQPEPRGTGMASNGDAEDVGTAPEPLGPGPTAAGDRRARGVAVRPSQDRAGGSTGHGTCQLPRLRAGRRSVRRIVCSWPRDAYGTEDSPEHGAGPRHATQEHGSTAKGSSTPDGGDAVAHLASRRRRRSSAGATGSDVSRHRPGVPSANGRDATAPDGADTPLPSATGRAEQPAQASRHSRRAIRQMTAGRRPGSDAAPIRRRATVGTARTAGKGASDTASTTGMGGTGGGAARASTGTRQPRTVRRRAMAADRV